MKFFMFYIYENLGNTLDSCVYPSENKHFFMHENSLKIMESHKMLGFYGCVVFKSCFICWYVSSLKLYTKYLNYILWGKKLLWMFGRTYLTIIFLGWPQNFQDEIYLYLMSKDIMFSRIEFEMITFQNLIWIFYNSLDKYVWLCIKS